MKDFLRSQIRIHKFRYLQRDYQMLELMQHEAQDIICLWKEAVRVATRACIRRWHGRGSLMEKMPADRSPLRKKSTYTKVNAL